MAFTQDQYNALVAAIAQGALSVKYADKEVVYRSLADMQNIKRQMETELGIGQPGIKTKLAQFSSGL